MTERVDLGRRGTCFPLEPSYDRAHETLSGRSDAYGIREDAPLYGSHYDEYGVEKKCIFSRADAKVVQKAERIESDEAVHDDMTSELPGSRGEPESVSDLAVATPSDPSSSSSSGPIPLPPLYGPPIPPVEDEEQDEPKWYIDRSGRRYPADKHGQKISRSRCPDNILQFAKDRNAACEAARVTTQADAAAAVSSDAASELDWQNISDSIERIHVSVDEMSLKAQSVAAPAVVATSNGKQHRSQRWKDILSDNLIPKLPCKPSKEGHREKNPRNRWMLPALVARPVPKKGIAMNPVLKSGSCKDALDKEWTRLREKGVWDETSVKNWKDVARQARIDKRIIHMGRVFGIMVEKNHELDKDDKNRKFKYRVVFQGNNVCIQDYESAIFQDLGSSPASMEARARH